jgi:hypothetical protein
MSGNARGTWNGDREETMMNGNGSYTIYAQVEKNRLYIQLVGKITFENIQRAADLTIEETRKLRPGFDVITDITRFVPLSKQDAQEINRAQLFIKNSGVGRIIRVVDMKANLVANLQFERTGKEAGYTVNPDIAGSKEEAEKKLDQKN